MNVESVARSSSVAGFSRPSRVAQLVGLVRPPAVKRRGPAPFEHEPPRESPTRRRAARLGTSEPRASRAPRRRRDLTTSGAPRRCDIDGRSTTRTVTGVRGRAPRRVGDGHLLAPGVALHPAPLQEARQGEGRRPRRRRVVKDVIARRSSSSRRRRDRRPRGRGSASAVRYAGSLPPTTDRRLPAALLLSDDRRRRYHPPAGAPGFVRLDNDADFTPARAKGIASMLNDKFEGARRATRASDGYSSYSRAVVW